MPNWVKNRLSIVGTPDDIANVVRSLQNSEGNLSFQTIVPRPAIYDKRVAGSCWIAGKLFENYIEETIPVNPAYCSRIDDRWVKYDDGWRDWYFNVSDSNTAEPIRCIRKPTPEEQDEYRSHGADTWYKWNIRYWGTKWDACEPELSDSGDTFLFDTAWSHPSTFYEALAKRFPTIRFHFDWADEDIGNNAGTGDILNGYVNAKFLEGNEAYEKAFELWEGLSEEYELVDGEYKYIADKE